MKRQQDEMVKQEERVEEEKKADPETFLSIPQNDDAMNLTAIDADEETPPTSPSKGPATNSSFLGHPRDKRRLHIMEITQWLTDEVIGLDADPYEMEQYAVKFLEHGLHSVAMIKEMATPADIASFAWMREFHKRRFLFWAHQSEHHDKEHWGKSLNAITDWLEKEVIAYEPDRLEMGLYAQKFLDLGYHSVAMIKDFCTPDEVASWQWMRPAHKRLFLFRGKLQRIRMPKKSF